MELKIHTYYKIFLINIYGSRKMQFQTDHVPFFNIDKIKFPAKGNTRLRD